MPDYEHHIFVSYCRLDKYWVRWTLENFVEPLRSLLRPALRKVEIFADDKIETGVSWPPKLARAHAHSCLLIPILSRAYFSSDWCRLELALMHHREKERRYRTVDNENVLILPLVIDDGKSFPPEVQKMQAEDIHDFANPFMQANSRNQEEFTEWLRKWCPRVVNAVETVPQFETAWEQLGHDQFNEMFRIKSETQRTLPSLSLLPIPGPPTSQ
jgi:hypothetical protein